MDTSSIFFTSPPLLSCSIDRCGHTINDHLRAGILERMSSKGRPGFGVGETVQGKVKKMHGINRLGTEAAGEAVTEEGEFVDMVVWLDMVVWFGCF